MNLGFAGTFGTSFRPLGDFSSLRRPFTYGQLFYFNDHYKFRFNHALSSNITNLFVDCVKLPFPCMIVQERSMIESIVVGTVSLGVTRWCQDSHFMTIYSITSIKVFHFICHL